MFGPATADFFPFAPGSESSGGNCAVAGALTRIIPRINAAALNRYPNMHCSPRFRNAQKHEAYPQISMRAMDFLSRHMWGIHEGDCRKTRRAARPRPRGRRFG